MEVIGLALVVALASQFWSLFKRVQAGDWKSAISQLGVWASGVAAVFLVGETVFDAPEFAGHTLAELHGWDKVVLGLQLGAGAGIVFDFKKAFDSSDSAREPSLGERVDV